MPSVIYLLVLGVSVRAPFSSMLCLHGGILPVKSKLILTGPGPVSVSGPEKQKVVQGNPKPYKQIRGTNSPKEYQ